MRTGPASGKHPYRPALKERRGTAAKKTAASLLCSAFFVPRCLDDARVHANAPTRLHTQALPRNRASRFGSTGWCRNRRHGDLAMPVEQVGPGIGVEHPAGQGFELPRSGSASRACCCFRSGPCRTCAGLGAKPSPHALGPALFPAVARPSARISSHSGEVCMFHPLNRGPRRRQPARWRRSRQRAEVGPVAQLGQARSASARHRTIIPDRPRLASAATSPAPTGRCLPSPRRPLSRPPLVARLRAAPQLPAGSRG